MFGRAGHVYVYMIYGMYFCLNVVTERKGFPAAVLVRALEPVEGIESMIRNRRFDKENASAVRELHLLANGPGKLCQAMNIDRKLNGEDLLARRLWIEDRGVNIPKKKIVSAKRIGIEYAGRCRNYPWRFYIKGSNFISKA
jgi:DNA-3-methyladenine glycosylase